ncbi:inhibitor of growth protein 1-like [Amyelois transitella]|uniref:inhibitor of growth protein 1-like n=1 Tax=Amyelois transitella TaxID=680683 RepID=UPI00298F5530|nr:inhibitor of growth protein 1-like [Amyelois transitella]
MRTAARTEPVKTTRHVCGRCGMSYKEYKQLVEHLYWRHGTESAACKQCRQRKWDFAPHRCHVLPYDDANIESDMPQAVLRQSPSRYEFCYCGVDIEDSAMIGCDGAQCALKWYHFQCVGIVDPPDGEWFCPQCISQRTEPLQQQRIRQLDEKPSKRRKRDVTSFRAV